MDKKTYQSVCENNSLPNGILFPIPFVLEVPKNLEKDIKKCNNIVTLTDDRDGTKLATV
jgi:ATP sulfurylase